MKRFRISLVSLIVYPLFAYFLGVRTILLFLTAVVFHECGHLTAIRLLGQKVDRVTFSLCGAVIYRHGNSTYLKDTTISFAGPFVGLLAGVLGRFLGFELFFRVSAVYSLVNMLPVIPLDGGCFLRSLLLQVFDYGTAVFISDFVNAVTLTIVYISSVLLLLFTEWNVTLLAMCISIFIVNFLTQKM